MPAETTGMLGNAALMATGLASASRSHLRRRTAGMSKPAASKAVGRFGTVPALRVAIAVHALLASRETGETYVANNARTSLSQAPQPEQAPVALDRLSRSSTPLSTSRLICSVVVPLQRQIMSFFLSGVVLVISMLKSFFSCVELINN